MDRTHNALPFASNVLTGGTLARSTGSSGRQ